MPAAKVNIAISREVGIAGSVATSVLRLSWFTNAHPRCGEGRGFRAVHLGTLFYLDFFRLALFAHRVGFVCAKSPTWLHEGVAQAGDSADRP
jgi:hypothetical protein